MRNREETMPTWSKTDTNKKEYRREMYNLTWLKEQFQEDPKKY